jgi:hypothetical protein
VAHVDPNLIVLALSVSVAQQSDLLDRGDDALNFDADLVRGASLLPVLKRVVVKLVVKRLGNSRLELHF